MGRHFGMRVGGRVGGVRVSVGRSGGVRVGTGVSSGRARAGVSLSQHGGLGGGASYGTNAVRVGTNGKRVSVGVTGKTGVLSYGGGVGYRIWHGVHAPATHYWVPDRSKAAGARLVPFVLAPTLGSLLADAHQAWMHSPGWDEKLAPFFRHPILLGAILLGRFVTMIREAAGITVLPIL